MIIHLIRPARGTNARSRSRGTVMRRYPRIFYRAGCPSSVLSCTAWGFSCLANYFASGEPYLAFSPLPVLDGKLSASPTSQRTGGLFSVTLSVKVCFREPCPHILRGMLPYGVRTFLQQVPLTRDSPAIICHRQEVYHNQESRKAGAMEVAR